MDIIRGAKMPYDKADLGEPFATLDAPEGWKGTAWRHDDEFQSWDRPFQLELRIARFAGEKGPRIVADTGEAFSWFDRATMAKQMGMTAGFGGGLFGGLGMLGGFGMPSFPAGMLSPETMLVSVSHTGRPEQRFASPSAYLDSIMIEVNDLSLARLGPCLKKGLFFRVISLDCCFIAVPVFGMPHGVPTTSRGCPTLAQESFPFWPAYSGH